MNRRYSTKQILLIFMSIVVFVTAAVMLLFVSDGHNSIARKMDNPIVYKKYMGWHTVSVSELGTFMLPQEWTVEWNENTVSILDADQDLALCGYIVKSELKPEEEIDNRRTFVYSELLGLDVDEAEFINEGLPVHNDFRNGGYLRLVKVTFNDGTVKSFYTTILIGERYTLSLICLGDVHDETIRHFAQALAFSFQAT